MYKIKNQSANLLSLNRSWRTKFKIKLLLLLMIFAVHLFFRFYQLEERNSFGWDQVDFAWAAKNIIVDHNLPLVGMVVKQNTGFFVGPLYYYLNAFFYWIFNLDPIASVIFAGLTSIVFLFTLFFITKKLFSFEVALIAVFINTFCIFVINADRVQWSINLIPPVSLAIFYFLHQIINGKTFYLIWLAIAVGFSFHIHFTSLFYLIIILLSLPLFPRNKSVIKYGLISFPLFIVWLIPNIIYDLSHKASSSRNMLQYVNTYYHGIHLKRIYQLFSDAFIEFEEIITFKILKPLKYVIFPVFVYFYLFPNMTRKKFILCYVMLLWILVPWFVFSIYSGEISNYYFSLIRPIAIISLSYITWRFLQTKYIVLKVLTVLFWIYYSASNVTAFFVPVYRPLAYHRAQVENAIKEGKIIEFSQYIPGAYIYYVYKRNETLSKSIKK